MEVQIFDPLTEEKSKFQDNKLGVITQITRFSITEKFRGYGNFELMVPINARFADFVKEHMILCVGRKYWLRVTSVIRDEQDASLTFAGTDLKGFLGDRITVYSTKTGDIEPGTEGYTQTQGASETVLKYFIEKNIANPEDPNRKLPGFVLAEDKKRGLKDDRYMSRFDPLDEVAEKICKNADIGYSVVPDLANDQLVFDVIVPVNRTADQEENGRVVFAVDRNNIGTLIHTKDIDPMRNTFYATKTGSGLESKALTLLIHEDSKNVQKGAFRREVHLNVSCDKAEEIQMYAKKDMEEYKAISEIEVQTSQIQEYESRYFLGDYVTAKIRTQRTLSKSSTSDTVEAGWYQLDTQITQVRRVFTHDSETLTLTFGEKSPKILNKLERKMNNLI